MNQATKTFFVETIKRKYGRPPLYIFVLLFLIVFIMVLPVIHLVIRGMEASSNDWNLLFSFRSFEIFKRSFLLMFTVTFFSFLIAMPLAWITVRTNLVLKKMWTILVTLPLVIPSFVGAFLFDSVLSPKGLLQKLLEILFDIEKIPEIYGLFGATLVLVLLTYPYLFLTIRSALINVDSSGEDIARSLGHNFFSRFINVIFPQLRPAIIAGSLLVALYVLSDFGVVSLMKYNTFTWIIYQQYESVVERSASAILSFALVLTAILIIVLEYKTRGNEKYYRVGRGSARESSLIKLGIWHIPIVIFVISIVALALFLPVGVLIFWFVRGISFGEPVLLLWEATYNSIFLSIITAGITIFLSFCMGIVLVRHKMFINKFLEPISFTGYALPGIVVGISLVFFGIHYGFFLYQTKYLLIIAYIILFFPVALGTIRSSLLQINPIIIESGHLLKHNYLGVMVKIILPLMKSGFLMSAAMVFLLTMKELPATLILGPIGMKTLSMAVWSASSEAFFAQAAAPALMLIIITILPLSFLLKGNNRFLS